MSKVVLQYVCNICNRSYSGYQSLWIHNNKFHKNSVTYNVTSSNSMVTSDNRLVNNNTISNEIRDSKSQNKTFGCMNNKIIKCSKCNLIFSSRQTRWRHEKICNFNTFPIEKNQILKTDIVKINDQSNTIVKMNKSDNISKSKIIYIDKSPNNNSIRQNNIFIEEVSLNDNTITFNDKKIKYFSYQNQLYFKAKDIMQIIGYEDTKQFIRNNIDDKHKIILKNFINNNQVDYELKIFLENQEPFPVKLEKLHP